jgi:hypothetical protein
MKTEKDAQDLVDASRIAASVPMTDFWKELEERMTIRDESEQDLVKPRAIKD